MMRKRKIDVQTDNGGGEIKLREKFSRTGMHHWFPILSETFNELK